ncbi:TetR/AcrR family transcriptional regulator [Streptomyces sp. NPDC017979]|uniref:TetR/AcrR family transcriptional regulator n=1 Tax=Streptomyces sp. NPDC017979 TaxID=3365024 RepID=UPI0037958144
MTEEQPARGPGRPAQLSVEAIVGAALESGANELTVRGLARRLGVTHKALYRWVGDRDGLLDLISDHLLGRVLARTAGAPADDWRAWLTGFGRLLRAEFLPVADAEVLAQFPRETSTYKELQQQAEAVMGGRGLTQEQARDSFAVFLFAVWGWIAAEKLCAEQPDHERTFTAMLDALARGLPSPSNR